MKIRPSNPLFVASILLIIGACSKSNNGPAENLPGDWVLQYSDSANIRSYFPQDKDFGIFSSWAAHLKLQQNDSAFWNSFGVDAMPISFSDGTYTLVDDNGAKPIISFSFRRGGWIFPQQARYFYTFRTRDSLVLQETDRQTLLSFARHR